MFSQLYAIIFTSLIVINVAVKPSDIMIDTEESIDNREVNNNVIEKEDTVKLQSNPVCHMEVQITRHIVGYCIKHGLASHSCVADGYLHPFHRECLS